MVKLTKIIFALTLCMFHFASKAQTDRDQIIANFEIIEYYPDSTISAVYNVKRGKYHGYSIEFDSIGNPEWIGRYKKGLKHGGWRRNDALSRYYKKGKWDWGSRPGCGTGVMKAQARFQERYLELIED